MQRRDVGVRYGVPLALAALGVALAALFVVARDTPIDHVRWIGTAPPVSEPAFAEVLAAVVPVAMDSGSSAWLLPDGEGTFPALLRDLQSARRTITFHVYYWRPGRLADRIVEALAERARAGVRVLVLFDDVGASGNGEAVDRLRDAGAEVATLRAVPTLSLRRAQQRSHLRAIVIDGRIAYTGGFGIADSWLGNGRSAGQWRETNARISGAGVAQVQGAFSALWAEATGDLMVGEAFFPSDPPASSGWTVTPPVSGPYALARSGIAYTIPSGGSTGAERLLALAVSGARSRLYVSNAYFVPDEDFRALLTRAAARGVDVRILMAGETTDIPLTRLAAWSYMESLLESGVRVWEYQPSMMHAKTLVADGALSLLGSMNFDNRSLAMNEEITLVAQDSALGGAMERMFLDDLTRSTELTSDMLRQRGVWQRARELAARTISSLL